MTRVILLLAVLGVGLGTLAGCTSDKSTPPPVTGVQTGGEPVSTLKGTGRLPKVPQ